ncbi:solute carrier organic anion transporter family member 2A1 [Sphaeramia orbicularis]|uniref:Solute carrier organic anion transporter family member n=1 Tax=Sphaeramia orbicularis TaxID=375764 RepID=A0A672YG62_9TELE|nr:solute carrier organic anion transporter family member 2A1-like [Sphaeramia orbicularis]
MDKHPFKELNRPRRRCFTMKLFVLCHGFLQFAQLMYSAYFKSTITTIERRFGLSSSSSATITAFHEISNTCLIIFMSYFGSRVHRPRFIGVGGLVMGFSALFMTLPHFVSKPYEYDSVLHDHHDICSPVRNSSNNATCDIDKTSRLSDSEHVLILMGFAQLTFGIGTVPIQPFGISYIDDFSSSGGSSLNMGLMFALSVFGPAFGFVVSSGMLRIYVDVDKTGFGAEQELTPSDPRWVGAWWIGLLINAAILFITSIPFFYFPRKMPPEENVVGPESNVNDDFTDDVSFCKFIARFPRRLLSFLLNPLYMLMVLAQCCFSSVVAGLSTFLNKYLEQQYSVPLGYSSLLVGLGNLPAAAVGILFGGFLLKMNVIPPKRIVVFCVAVLMISTVICIPLFFLGCPNQKVTEVNYNLNGSLSRCYSSCSCPESAFNPVCGSDGIEYVSPCHAGCSGFTRDPNNTHKVQMYTDCKCVSGNLTEAKPTPCPKVCPSYLIFIVISLIACAALVGNFAYVPMYKILLSHSLHEEKPFALGIQFLVIRMLAWIPAPVVFGKVIDLSCTWWKRMCGKKRSCAYYDNYLFRNRYIGLQVGYKLLGITMLLLYIWKSKGRREYNLRRDGELMQHQEDGVDIRNGELRQNHEGSLERKNGGMMHSLENSAERKNGDVL